MILKSAAWGGRPAGLATAWVLLALLAPAALHASSLFLPPGARSGPAERSILGDRFVASRSFSSPASPAALLFFYRDALGGQGWVETETVLPGVAGFRKDDVFFQLVLQAQEEDFTGGTILLSFPLTGEEKEGLIAGEEELCPGGEIEMYRSSEREEGVQDLFTIRCGDSPQRFFSYLLPMLESLGWRPPEGMEQFRPFLPANRTWHFLERDAEKMQVFALPGGARGWRYAFLTTSHKEQ